MNYSSSFKDFLKLADERKETYIGYGNPDSQILLIANEPGSVNPVIQKWDLDRNLLLWQKNEKNSVGFPDLLNVFDKNRIVWERFNPLHPYFGQHFVQAVFKEGCDNPINAEKNPTSRTFKQYQKLTDLIRSTTERKLSQSDYIDFFKSAFVMDFSSVSGARSKDIDSLKRNESIKNRLPLFQSQFIESFPIVIVASGHYIRDISVLNDLTKVFKNYEFIKQEPGWLNIHKRSDGKGILLHTKHLAFASDMYLNKIAEMGRPYFNPE